MSTDESTLGLDLAPADLGVWNLDVKTGRAIVSEELARMLGLSAVGRSSESDVWAKLIHPDDRPRVYEKWGKLVRSDAILYEDEFRVANGSGAWIWVLSRGHIMERSADGRPLQVLGTLFDITHRKRAEEALRASEARYRALVENAPLGVVEIDHHGRLVAANKPLLDLIGAPSVEELREEFDALAGPRLTGAGIAEAARRCLEEDERGTLETTWESRWGRKPEVRVHYAPLRANGEGGKPTGAVAFVEDVTERRTLEAQLQHVQKLESLGVLAGGIAHDFNNLLVAILGNADLALSNLVPADPEREPLEDIVTAAQRAADLCNQMLAYAGKGRVVTQTVDLAQVVEEMAHLLEVCISKKAQLRFEFEGELPAIDADVTPLRQVIMNLITNASEALGEQEGVIRLAVCSVVCTADELASSLLGEGLPEGCYVKLEVSDTGAGMDATTLARIFDPFYTTKFAGHGLGLAAVIGIVRAHRGAIHAKSEPGHGSTFQVLLPASTRRAERTIETASHDDGWRGSGTILVADDEIQVRSVIGKMLAGAGFDVLLVKDGGEAVEMFRERADEIRCVVLDLTMPRMGGEEALRAIREIRSAVPVILASGFSERDIALSLADQGFAGFLQKPFKGATLLSKVRELLEAMPNRATPDPGANGNSSPEGGS